MAQLIQRIADLIVKKLKGELNETESRELFKWVEASSENFDLYTELTNSKLLQRQVKEYYSSRREVLEKIMARIEQEPQAIPMPSRSNRVKYMAAAAAVLITLSVATYLYIHSSPDNTIAVTPGSSTIQLKDFVPGANRAILTLSDGSVITLDSSREGTLAKEGNINIIQSAGGEVKYTNLQPASATQQLSQTYNTLSTPKGGQYQLHLPDGSKVWLNASSTIRYPVAFAGNERRVMITGEAYFEVAASPNPSGGGGKGKIPFIVSIVSPTGEAKGEVEVLGTHFNINAYADEPTINTTLLEGKVKVSSSMAGGEWSILKPGQQAQIGNNSSTLSVINHANTEEAVAWKNGLFYFSGVDIQTILRQASRWYDIEIIYSNDKPKDTFSGYISRNINLEQLLKILELSEVNLKLEEGRRLVVMPTNS